MKEVITHPLLGEVTVSRTKRARRISVSVRPPGKVRLTIPAGCSVRSGMAFLNEKTQWIADTLQKVAEKYPVRIIEPPYRTIDRDLIFNQTETNTISGRITSGAITITFPHGIDHRTAEVQEVARRTIIRALKAEAAKYLPPMVDEIANRLGFKYGKVSVRTTVSRWGSCSSANDISLSVFLMRLPQHLIEYIIIHELCHTKYRNHSDRFHKLVDSILNGREQEFNRELRKYRTDVI